MKKITITVFSILMLLALCGFTYENTNSDLVKHEYISTETENVSKIVIADVNADILIKNQIQILLLSSIMILVTTRFILFQQ